jgi:CubicO group peptidase (beta-lactamase class C family)
VSTPLVHGTVAAGWEPVRDVFERGFAEGVELGAGLCVLVDGEPVVDLWGGWADVAATRAWQADTPCLLFSSTKAATTLCLLALVERGLLRLDDPVARLWPEFAEQGKGAIPIRWLLDHRAGLPAPAHRLTQAEIAAWTPAAQLLAAQAPEWEPGTRHGYHGFTFGWLVGEVVLRATGGTIGTFLARELAGPLGLRMWMGVPDAVSAEVADLDTAGLPDWRSLPFPPDSLVARVFGSVELAGDLWNGEVARGSEIPAANAVADARSLARLYAAVLGPVGAVRLLGDGLRDEALTASSSGPDAVLGVDTTFGLGFVLGGGLIPGLRPGAFGHPGTGGSLGYADPARGLAFGYVPNRMLGAVSADHRAQALMAAVVDCSGG